MTDPVRTQHCQALGLPADQKLIADDVTAAWRQANLRWHPKRPSADPVRHLAAQTAYAYLLEHLGGDSSGDCTPQNPSQLRSLPRTPITPPTHINPPPPLLPVSAPPPPMIEPPYSIRHHDGADKLCLELRIPLRKLVEGDRVRFRHLNGKEYALTVPPGTWGGIVEVLGLGLSPIDPLLILLCPLFPPKVPSEARQLIAKGLALCDETETHSLMLHELIPALTK